MCIRTCTCVHTQTHTHTVYTNRQTHPDSLLTNMNISSIYIYVKSTHLGETHGLVLKSLHSQAMKKPWEIVQQLLLGVLY